jgi:hypothetical protein
MPRMLKKFQKKQKHVGSVVDPDWGPWIQIRNTDPDQESKITQTNRKLINFMF